jgi:hypothetical protein
MPWSLVILAVSIFAFIMSMIAMLGCFFGEERKRVLFLLLLACVLISGACTAMELHRFLTPPPPPEQPVFNRQPFYPL